MDVEVFAETTADEAFVDLVHDLARYTLREEEVPDDTEVSVSFVTADRIAQLNMDYRKQEGPTDVLSFPMDSIKDPRDPGEPLMLGDVVIALSVAQEQAREYGKSVRDEVSLLLVHGILHLLDYDHLNDLDADIMERRESEILKSWPGLEGADE